MKLEKKLSLVFLVAALVFCISCGGGGSKYPDETDDPTKEDEDSKIPDESQSDGDSEENDTDNAGGDTDTKPDSDIDPTDEPHPHDDADSETDDADSDSSDADTESGDEDEDTDTDSNDDKDSSSPDEDIDGEQPDIDEKEDAAVLCTGQTQCFNTYQEISCGQTDSPFYGQDALYASQGYCLQKSLDATTDLVTDNITGLVWQRNLPSKYDGCTGNSGATCLHDQALSYCENLEYAGYSDWRLPSPEEFATIIDYGKEPAIDSDKLPLPKTSNKTFWTRTELVSSNLSNPKFWYVNFSNGETTDDEDKAKYVRCVRGSQLEKPQFKVENEIVEDTVHNLIWTKDENSVLSSWESALDHCQNLEYGGYDDWRLPSINELASLIDYSQKDPASLFPGISSTYFWSSTSSSYIPNAWTVILSTGKIIYSTDKTNTARVICVR